MDLAMSLSQSGQSPQPAPARSRWQRLGCFLNTRAGTNGLGAKIGLRCRVRPQKEEEFLGKSLQLQLVVLDI